MAALNPDAPEYLPLCPTFHHLPTTYHHIPYSSLLHSPYSFPPSALHLQLPAPRPLPPPAAVTPADTSATHRRSYAGGGASGSTVVGLGRNPEAVRRTSDENQSWGCEKRRLGKHCVIPVRYFQKKTSVMIKNIPYICTQEMLLEFVDEHCRLENEKARKARNGGANERGVVVSAYDFLYLPMDFKTNKSKGYAFVNFTHHVAVWRFFQAFHQKPNVFQQSLKLVNIVSAKIQGKEDLVRRFKSTTFYCDTEDYLPVWFTPARDGSGRPVKAGTVGKCRRRI